MYIFQKSFRIENMFEIQEVTVFDAANCDEAK